MATKKPCPGCGEVKPKRRANEVCAECLFKLSRYDDLEEENKKLREMQDYVECYYTLPYESRGAHVAIALAIADLLSAMPKRGNVPLVPATMDVHGVSRRLIEIADSEYKRGLKDGTRLLQRLNEGSISMDDFLFHKRRGI